MTGRKIDYITYHFTHQYLSKGDRGVSLFIKQANFLQTCF